MGWALSEILGLKKCKTNNIRPSGRDPAVSTTDKVPAPLVLPVQSRERDNNQINNQSINTQTNKQDPFSFSRVGWWHLQASASGHCLLRSHDSDRGLSSGVINGDSLGPGPGCLPAIPGTVQLTEQT